MIRAGDDRAGDGMGAVTGVLRRYPIIVPILVVLIVFAISYATTGNLIRGWWLLRVPAERSAHDWNVLAPFSDVIGTVSALECARKGVDVYAANPCDPWHRFFTYPPVWLLLRHLGIGLKDVNAIGFAYVVAFLAAAANLFVRADWRLGAFGALILASPPVLLAIERGNNDIPLFVLTMIGLRAMHRGAAAGPDKAESGKIGATFVFVATTVLCAFLKMYPVAAYAALWRSRRTFIVANILAAVTGVLVLFVFSSYFASTYGRFPLTFYHSFGYVVLASYQGPWEGSHFALMALKTVLGVVCLGVLFAGYRLAPYVATITAPLTPFERSALKAGLAIYAFTFLYGSNFSYRLIWMLLAYPALLHWTETRHRMLGWIGIVGLLVFYWMTGGAMWVEESSSLLAWCLFAAAGVYLFGLVVGFWRLPAARKRAETEALTPIGQK
jgi:hypothetical protein